MTSPAGKFINSNSISTPHRLGLHVGIMGSSQYSYEFYANTSSCSILVGADGKITVSGWFSQYDTFSSSSQNGRRFVRVCILDNSNPSAIIKMVCILQSSDGTEWVYKSFTIGGLSLGTYMIGIGRADT